MNSELQLDISHYYEHAKSLRATLRDQSEDVRIDTAKRFSILTGLDVLEPGEILQKNISLRQAKQVIAKEQGFEDWPQLRIEIEKKVADIQEHCEGQYCPKGLPPEPGDVISGDLILLGTFSQKSYVVDAILMDLFQAIDCPIGPGVVLVEQEPPTFDPNTIPDLPEDDEGWPTWSQDTAHALGIEGA